MLRKGQPHCKHLLKQDNEMGTQDARRSIANPFIVIGAVNKKEGSIVDQGWVMGCDGDLGGKAM